AVAQGQQVAGGGKVQLAIVVEVAQSEEAPTGRGESAFLSESAVTVAQVRNHRAAGGHQQIGDTVAVQVAGDRATSVEQSQVGSGLEGVQSMPGSQQDGDTRGGVHGQV